MPTPDEVNGLPAEQVGRIARLVNIMSEGAWHVTPLIDRCAPYMAKESTAGILSYIDAIKSVCTLRGWDASGLHGEVAFRLFGGRGSERAIDRSGFSPTPWTFTDPAVLPKREWIYGKHMLRKYLSVVVAPGGTGKSNLLLGEAICMAAGKNLLGDEVIDGPKRVWYWNLEDPNEEAMLRIAGFCQHHGIHPLEIEGRLFVDSGRDQELCLAVSTREGCDVLHANVNAVIAALQARKIDVLIIDPFVNSHQVSENDNGAINTVAREWGKIANAANCSIVLVHHTKKLDGKSAGSESVRGASALVSAARSCRAINHLSDVAKSEAGIDPTARGYVGWTDEKNNLAAGNGRVRYIRIVSEELANGDSVGVVELYRPPEVQDEDIAPEVLKVAEREIRGLGFVSASTTAAGGIIRVLAEALNRNEKLPGDMRFLERVVSALARRGTIVTAFSRGRNGKELRGYEVRKGTADAVREAAPSGKEDLFA